jgi:hypothetical protein
MARPLCRARPIGFAALIALLGLSGCVYEDPRYGGYDYGGVGANYDNGYPYYDDYGYGYRPRPYGYRYYQPRYGYPYRNQHRRHRNDYCDYNSCDWDDDD